ncbi:protein-domain-containing protein [Halteromyces radiatus]|uniref:protein-domain-containing protein n=1 Tax=Halteromyces radiatus TaxID=101107 RepID=UPI0022202A68|nr:protein-domain-containing protein [Halteromyces radiatus]KAI8078774.1 protein-domain-containing protein [Halteromyces radiatus]
MEYPGYSSELFDLDPIEKEDELDLELAKYYNQYCSETNDKSEREHHNYIQEKASRSKTDYMEIVSALLYGILTNPETAQHHFQSISLVNRDQYTMLFSRLFPLVTSIKFASLKIRTKDQLLWLYNELTNLNIPSLEGLYLCLLRQIKGGDLSPPNIRLCDQILKLLETHPSWLDAYPRVTSVAVYTYLRLITEHRPIQLTSLQQREIRFVITLLRQKWHECSSIGRDLIRGLHDVYHLPEFRSFWIDMLEHPQKISPNFQGIESVLKTPTSKDFLRARLTPDMEHKLMYILQHLRIGQFQRNLGWFIQRFLSTPEAEPFYTDIIRFIVAGWYPNNQILQSDIVPRYVVIGSMIRAIKSTVVAANVKTALIYDWLFFTPTDNIMFIEPAMLLIERSAERYPYITASLIEFINQSILEYYKPMTDYMMKCVKCGMQLMLSKSVIRSLLFIYQCPSTDQYTKQIMHTLFEEFLQEPRQPTTSSSSSLSSIATTATSTTTTDTALDTSTVNKLDNREESTVASKLISTQGTEMIDQDEDDMDKYLYGEHETSETMTVDMNGQDDNVNQDSKDRITNIEEKKSTFTSSIDTEEVSLYETEKSSTIMELDNIPDDSKSTHTATTIESSDQTQQQQEQIIKEDTFDSGSDFTDDENEKTEGDGSSSETAMQSHQSYWLFGDALTRFKTACGTLLSNQLDVDDEEFSVQLIIAKRSLKEILAVFLRMSIPAETLAPSIGRPIVKLASRLLIEKSHTDYNKDDMTEDDVIMDTNKDPLDLILLVYWQTKEDAATKEKMVHLLGYMMHRCRVGKKHVLGMRWWLFIASQLKSNTYLMTLDESDDWTSLVSRCYEEYVLQDFDSSADMEEKDYLGHILFKDLRLLSRYNIEAFHKVLPLVYHRLSLATTGNINLLKLMSHMALPDQIGELVCTLRLGTIRVFGDTFDTTYLGATFEKSDIYEASAVWQVLAAEVQTSTHLGDYLAKSDFILPCQNHFRPDIVPYLLTVLSSISPTESLLQCIIQISCQTSFNHPTARRQFSLLVIKTWHGRYPEQLQDVLVAWTKFILDDLQMKDDASDDLYKMASLLIQLLRLWWKEEDATSRYSKNDRSFCSIVLNSHFFRIIYAK